MQCRAKRRERSEILPLVEGHSFKCAYPLKLIKNNKIRLFTIIEPDVINAPLTSCTPLQGTISLQPLSWYSSKEDRASQSQIVCGLSLRFYFGLWPSHCETLPDEKTFLISAATVATLATLATLENKKTAQTIWFKPPFLSCFKGSLSEGAVERSETEGVIFIPPHTSSALP